MMIAKLAKLKPREKIGIAVALVCVLGLLVYRLVVFTVVAGLNGLDAEILIQKDNLSKNLRVVQDDKQVTKDYEAVTGFVGVASSSAEDIDAMKGAIDDLAKKSTLQLMSMEHRQPGPPKSPYYMEYVVEIGNFEGNTAGLLNFMIGLRALPGLMEVSKLTLAPGKSQGAVKGSMLITRVLRAKD